MNNKFIIIFTTDFPFGEYELTFLPQEIEVLSRIFEHIYLFPRFEYERKPLVNLPKNVRVINKLIEKNTTHRKAGDYFFSLRIFLMELFNTNNIKLIKNFKYHLSELLKFSDQAKELNHILTENKIPVEESVFYTYWFDEQNSALAVLKERYFKNIKSVSRAHGFDLYDERNPKGYIFPRYFQLKKIDKVFSISQNGANYLKSKFLFAKDKIYHSRLGILQTHSEFKTNKTDLIQIVSCSSLIQLKRVIKIVEILKFVNKNVVWTHFGDGPLLEEVKIAAKKLPINIKCDFRGNTDNKLVRKFYAENHVDWFLNVSEFEGVPVSIMEAISFGIPIIAPNIGGIGEIVNELTGVLVAKEIDSEKIAKIIEKISFNNEQRKLVHQFWKENYEAHSNYNTFAKELSTLS